MENDYSDWSDNLDGLDKPDKRYSIKCKIQGRINYLNSLGDLNKYLQFELDDANLQLQQIIDEEQRIEDNNRKFEERQKKIDDEKKALLKQKEDLEKSKWQANINVYPELDETIIELWNEIEEQLYNTKQVVLTNLINKLTDINYMITSRGISKIVVKELNDINDKDYYNLLISHIKLVAETNNKKYIRYKKSATLYSNFLLEKIEKIKEIRQSSLDNMSNKINIALILTF
jgi:hypothetical protein